MQDFQWVGKLSLATFGTAASIALQDTLSIIAAVLTIVFLLYNIRHVRMKMKGTIDNNKHNEFLRRQEVKNKMKETENAESSQEYN